MLGAIEVGSRKLLVVRATPRVGSNLLMCSLQQHPYAVSAGEYYVTRKSEYWPSIKDSWNLCKTCFLDPVPASEARTVFLYREDKEAQKQSYLLACKTGCWLPGFPNVEVEPLPNFDELVMQCEKEIMPTCDLAFSYERLVRDWNKVVSEVLNLWGVDQICLPKAIAKQAAV